MSDIKAKRRLTDFDFTQEGAHVALVHKAQGGGANGYTTLLTKSTNNRSEEFIKKASKVQVTLSLPDFLEKFFGVWGDNATLLATMFGYNPSDDKEGVYSIDGFWSWWRDECKAKGLIDSWGDYTVSPTAEDKHRWAISQLNNVDILKSAQAKNGDIEWLSTLSEDEHLGLLKDQEFIEKHFIRKEVNGDLEPKENIQKSVTTPTDINKKASKAVTQQESKMTDTTQADILKAKEVELQKAQTELLKAKEQLEQLAKENADRELEARENILKSAVPDAEKATTLFKAIGALDKEQFDEVVEVLKALNVQEQEKEMFTEAGSPHAGVDVTKSAQNGLRDRLLAKYNKA